jgi:hypothetical protein
MMQTPGDLFKIGIKQWEEFDDNFAGSDILIGNGFSINLCSRLNYRKLYEIFCQHSSKELQEIFEKLETSNFELVIDALHNGQIINHVLNLPTADIKKFIEDLKNGLITSIQDTHPTWRETNFPIIRSLAAELAQFKDIYTTNYDIFLYRIILAKNELVKLGYLGGSGYEDIFYDDISATELGFGQLFDSNENKIYYLHGSLFFFNNRQQTYKLRKIDGAVEFIKLIKKEIDNNNFPVFVAEGNYQDKLNAINNNYYLSYCLNTLKKKRSDKNNKLTTYGFSFSNPDMHIANMINISGIKNMAVSIYPNRSIEELEKEMSRINTIFGNISIDFYDSRSLFSFTLPKYAF